MLKNRRFYIILSFAISAILVWLLLSQIETQDLVQTFTRIHYPALVVYMAIVLVGTVFRALRYRWLLHPHPISWGNILLVTFVRNSLVDLLPARIGSLSYIYILNKRLHFTFEAATSSFVIAILFDFITLSPLLVFSLLVVGFGSSALPSFTLLLLSLVFFILICLLLWKVTQILSFLLEFYKSILDVFKIGEKKWATVSVAKIQSTVENLFQIKKRKIFWPLFSVSILIRLAKYGAIFFLLFSLLQSHGFTLQNLSFWKTILGTTGAEFTSVLPIKGVAGFGTWESAWALSFRLMDFDPRLAIISGIGVHLLSNLFEYSLGILAIVFLALPFLRKPLRKNK